MEEDDRPKPVCFMVMPFGLKPTGAEPGAGPARVDFNRLWEKALRPALVALGYEPVRADEDLGPLIINDMLDRLALADLVVADLTTSNANVYYEIGVRHGAVRPGVLISAKWSRQLFDLEQLRQVRYPLSDEAVSDAEAAEIVAVLKTSIPLVAEERGPLTQLGRGSDDTNRPAAFRRLVSRLQAFQSEVAAARAASGEARPGLVRRLLVTYGAQQPILPAVALELLSVSRDTLPFSETLTFIRSLPSSLRTLSFVLEQEALALSKAGDDLGAVGLLSTLITGAGDTSERQGLLGGRYKRLWEAALETRDTAAAGRYLDQAIAAYDRGMLLDLNDYYPASNLPSLLRARGDPGDLERAIAINHTVRLACEGALLRGTADAWTRPTLLTAAFDAGDAETAEALFPQVRREGAAAWQLTSTHATLARAFEQLPTGDSIRMRLEGVLVRLRALLPPD